MESPDNTNQQSSAVEDNKPIKAEIILDYLFVTVICYHLSGEWGLDETHYMLPYEDNDLFKFSFYRVEWLPLENQATRDQKIARFAATLLDDYEGQETPETKYAKKGVEFEGPIPSFCRHVTIVYTLNF